MRKKGSRISSGIVFIIVGIVCLLMISSSITIISGYSSTIENEAGDVALSYAESAVNYLKSGINAYKDMAGDLGRDLQEMSFENEKDFLSQLGQLTRRDAYGDIMFVRYFKDGVQYDAAGERLNEASESPAVRKLVEKRELSCAGVISDEKYNISTTAFCVPLEKCEYADVILVCYSPASVVGHSATYTNERYDNSRYVVVCVPQGEIIRVIYSDGDMDVETHGNIYDIVRNQTNEKIASDTLRTNLEAGISAKYPVDVAGDSCFIVSGSINEFDNTSFAIVGFYRAADIYTTGYFVLSVILGEFFIFFALILFVSIYGAVERARSRKLLSTINDTNKLIGCDSRIKFERVSAETISTHKGTLFAVIVIDINHFEYISGQIGNESTIKMLRHLFELLKSILGLDEKLGYDQNGRYVMLLHYRETSDLAERLNPIISIASQHCSRFTENFTLNFKGGIYTTDRKLTMTVTKMIDMAIDAEGATRYPCDFGVFRIYNETLYSSSVQNDYIEVNMENALKNHDFKVFYQAKYNIAENRVDGCEALVRWYNPKLDEYMQPDVFIPLFETNRFIVKLDHYVFEQVCIYISDSIANGLPLFPVSVNASRITALERDFVEYYASVKKKYNIADNFVTIELTESFANEDYTMLRDIVNELHKNGFKCSIDDFGSGFSSYNILKALPMDEIKLDRFFIKDGFSKERDYKIISSIITLGRSLNMKVTQEGVENSDELEALRKLGCQVIQGYFYSKPLTLTDYIGFLENKKII